MMEQFIIQSNSEGLATVERFITRLCDEKNVYNHYGTISMAVLQAVENAIVHGNQNDDSKQVIVECGDCRGGLYFAVQDQGQGFDSSIYGGFPEEGAKGEGIFIMSTLADKIEYKDGGRCVRMEFKIKGIDRIDSLERVSALDNYFAKRRVEA